MLLGNCFYFYNGMVWVSRVGEYPAAMIYFASGNSVLAQSSPNSAVHSVVESPTAVDLVATNSSRTLLATASGSSVNVYIVNAKTTHFHRLLGPLDLKSPIVSLKWHPVAGYDAGLLALTKHELVQIYSPPDIISKPVIERLRLVDEDGIAVDAAGLSIGSSNSPLGFLTLYLSSTDGEIYRLCPFTPPRIELTAKQLRGCMKFEMLSGMTFHYESWNDQHKCKVQVFGRETVDSIHYKLPPSLKLQPYPESFYEEDFRDLSVGNFGLSTDVLVQTSTHYVNFWCLPSPTSDRSVLVGSVKFAKPNADRKVLGVYGPYVDLSGSGDQHIFVKCDSMFAKPPAIQGIYNDLKVFGANPLVLTSKQGVFELPLGSQPGNLPSTDLPPIQKLRINPLVKDDFHSETMSQLSTKVTDVTVPIQRTELAGNVMALQDLHALAASFQTRCLELLKLTAKVRNEQQAQRRELLDQLEQARRLEEWSSQVRKSGDTTNEKLSTITTRQQKLNERFEKVRKQVQLLAALRSPAAPASSKAEQEWFAQIHNEDSEKVRKLAEQVGKVEQTVKHLRNPAVASSLPNPDENRITYDEMGDLKRRLLRQDTQIKALESVIH